jgi:hypothetical protein
VSYDLQVYAPRGISPAELLAVVFDAGLGVDDDEPDESLTIVRGARRGYSFTLALPVPVEVEDVPEQVTAVLLDAAYMYELLVEGSSSTETPHAVKFGRRLAEATHGALLDQQTDHVWTRGRLRTPPRAKAGTVSVVEVRWYVRSDFDAADAAAIWTRLARKHLPEALPRRYGTYEPLSRKLDNGGDEAFIEFVHNADGMVFFKGSQPVEGGHIDAGTQRGNAGAHTLTLLSPALDDSPWRVALGGLFLDVAKATDAIAATAELVRGVRWSGRSLGYDGGTERTAYLAWKGTWQGLPPYPVWWTWFGAEYSKVISEHLPPDQVEAFGSGLFHWRSDLPADRDALTRPAAPRGDRLRRVLGRAGNPPLSWLPDELLLTITAEAVGTYGVPRRAMWVPASLT